MLSISVTVMRPTGLTPLTGDSESSSASSSSPPLKYFGTLCDNKAVTVPIKEFPWANQRFEVDDDTVLSLCLYTAPSAWHFDNGERTLKRQVFYPCLLLNDFGNDDTRTYRYAVDRPAGAVEDPTAGPDPIARVDVKEALRLFESNGKEIERLDITAAKVNVTIRRLSTTHPLHSLNPSPPILPPLASGYSHTRGHISDTPHAIGMGMGVGMDMDMRVAMPVGRVASPSGRAFSTQTGSGAEGSGGGLSAENGDLVRRRIISGGPFASLVAADGRQDSGGDGVGQRQQNIEENVAETLNTERCRAATKLVEIKHQLTVANDTIQDLQERITEQGQDLQAAHKRLQRILDGKAYKLSKVLDDLRSCFVIWRNSQDQQPPFAVPSPFDDLS
ncbi:unnamed protein product [Vitrella brassicaformis CCMP3155]|uniref:Uncharacterized protein n=1 Tax=Vitrella brassicaformis (strain CCMP3155) TaxID=1169540 RepID=A0A0G4FWB7_VITBC|nr:unnamed protein product [Vitrella brassicaformis CCMP3155]|eukprot:CEM19413.1 unnamed protein product [Vitrella brassicaformis CCMP3155]